MALLVALLLAILGVIFIVPEDKSFPPRNTCGIGFILVLAAAFCICSSFIIKDDIREREMVVTSQETLAYQLVPFDFASSKYEIEDSTKISTYYVRFFDEGKFHFYYKTTQNGVEGFAPETIWSYNVFISENYEGTPMITETSTTYEFPITKFEKLWVGTESILTLRAKTIKTYEIYVPEGSIIETTN